MRQLRHWFRDQPIDRKFSIITTCVILAALLTIASVTLIYEYLAVRRAALQEIQVQASIIRDNSSAAIAFQDEVAATEVLDTLQGSPSIVRAALTLPDGRVFAHYSRTGTMFDPTTLPQFQTEQAVFNDDSIQLTKRVLMKDQFVGWLIMESSLEGPKSRIRFYALFIALGTLIALGVAHLIARRLISSITFPLSRLVNLSHEVARNDNYALREVADSRDEIGDLTRAFNTMLSKIQDRDVRLNQLAYRDNITGLNNRHYFVDHSERAVSNALRSGNKCCLMFLDLDRFKAVNDTLGHEVGDDLLHEVAVRLSSLLRKHDVICRIGGDEFAVVMENVKDISGVIATADKMINAVAQLTRLNGHDINIGTSVGISLCPDNADNVTELLRCADIAMYQAKRKGRGQYCIYDKSFEEATA